MANGTFLLGCFKASPIWVSLHNKLPYLWKLLRINSYGNTDSGELQLKDAYQFNLQQFKDLHWAKTIWSSDIPP
ncbi:hypothetical protein A2U01_0013190 [Trifolium medium]|uniref:Uncharacterized protein n=1 Tax=Trifolium medium TaxID=97028 RepID=A0A392MY59_9FABA|nr:hypothetical protein [Trifolium medium]